MSAWLLVSGDFTPYGGMDAANFALARYLAHRDDVEAVHLVGHQVHDDLARLAAVRVHHVPRPLGIHRFGEPLLRRAARLARARISSPITYALANGGNAALDDLNWVHYVHAAFSPPAAGLATRVRVGLNHRRYVAEERRALAGARVVICNSRRTADDVVMRVGVPRGRTKVIYYGVDPARFGPVSGDERRASRRALGVDPARPLALFVGALGDRRKGFDTVFDAWRVLCGRAGWDVNLLVVGVGSELEAWKKRADRELPDGRIRFLGARRDMPAVFAACDVLIHPARYEAYGLAVHEALCRGLPAVVSAGAGVAERYPVELGALLLSDPESCDELVARVSAWRSDAQIRQRVEAFAAGLRLRTWDHMAQDIVELAQGTGRSGSMPTTDV